MPIKSGLPLQQADRLVTGTRIGGCVSPGSLSLAEAALDAGNGEAAEPPPGFCSLVGASEQVLDSLVTTQIPGSLQTCGVRILEI